MGVCTHGALATGIDRSLYSPLGTGAGTRGLVAANAGLEIFVRAGSGAAVCSAGSVCSVCSFWSGGSGEASVGAGAVLAGAVLRGSRECVPKMTTTASDGRVSLAALDAASLLLTSAAC
ncbi:hypothetical protein [Variovorax fucosicus]|uniref:hypothetical protein n=1 Tax=Variovorax fucosicus TaxID=3053517 RepID=UPI002577EA1E|nr:MULTISPECIES: hypothetical protein [unclassified Variovorax]MDM0039373.1 hypothetical protein [Variovorax sp. J22R193]MDM0055017.1 hypothetical protein [Variovorax sp. J22G47]